MNKCTLVYVIIGYDKIDTEYSFIHSIYEGKQEAENLVDDLESEDSDYSYYVKEEKFYSKVSEPCAFCGSLSGVYYSVCDDCLTNNKRK